MRLVEQSEKQHAAKKKSGGERFMTFLFVVSFILFALLIVGAVNGSFDTKENITAASSFGDYTLVTLQIRYRWPFEHFSKTESYVISPKRVWRKSGEDASPSLAPVESKTEVLMRLRMEEYLDRQEALSSLIEWNKSKQPPSAIPTEPDPVPTETDSVPVPENDAPENKPR